MEEIDKILKLYLGTYGKDASTDNFKSGHDVEKQLLEDNRMKGESDGQSTFSRGDSRRETSLFLPLLTWQQAKWHVQDAGKKKILGPEYRARATEGMGEKDENLRREVAGEAGIPGFCLPTSLPKPCTTPVRCGLTATQLKTEDLG